MAPPIGSAIRPGSQNGRKPMSITAEERKVLLKSQQGELHAVTGAKTNMYYQRYSMNHGKASECLKCGLCERNCPQHIPIRRTLEEFAALYES